MQANPDDQLDRGHGMVIKAERAIASEALVAENSGLTRLVRYDLTGG